MGDLGGGGPMYAIISPARGLGPGPGARAQASGTVHRGLRDFIGTVGAGFRVTCLFSAALQFFSGSLSKIKTSPKFCSDKGCARGEYKAD